MNSVSSGAASKSAQKLDVAESYRQLQCLREMVRRAESRRIPFIVKSVPSSSGINPRRALYDQALLKARARR
jgi:hypothetical protein